MLAEISASQWYEWLAYQKIEPFADNTALWRAGLIAATIANVNRGKGKRAYKPDDFMPKFEREQVQPWQEQMAIAKKITDSWNG